MICEECSKRLTLVAGMPRRYYCTNPKCPKRGFIQEGRPDDQKDEAAPAV